MITYRPLSELLLGRSKKEQLQQGWSPQCEKGPSTDDNTWAVLKTTAIQPGRFLDAENKQLPASLTPRPQLEVRSGDLLLTCAGPRSRCAVPTLVRQTRPRLMISGKMYRFRTKESELDSRYLEFFLLSPTAQRLLNEMKTGISDSGLNLTKDRFLKLCVPVMPLPQQRQVVEALEFHFSHIDATERTIQAAEVRLRSWSQTLIDRALFRGPYPQVAVGGLLREAMRNGHSAPASNDGSGIRTLTLTAVTQHDFNDHNAKLTTADPNKVDNLWLEPGDILVQRSNTPELVGTSALYDGPRNWAIFPDLLIRLRANEGKVTTEYLATALRSRRVHDALRHRAKGLAGSMPKIDQAAISSLLIPLPPNTETQAILTERISQIEEAEKRALSACLEARQRSDALRRTLLEAAFSGRLTGRSGDVKRVEELANV